MKTALHETRLLILGALVLSDTGATLTVKEATHVAKIALLGNYIATSFVTAADGHGGTLLTQAVQTAQQPLLTHPVA